MLFGSSGQEPAEFYTEKGKSPSLTERPPNQPNPSALRPGWLCIPSTQTCPLPRRTSPWPPHLGLEADAVLEGVLVVQGDPQVVPIIHKVVLGFAGHGDPRWTRSSGGGGGRKGLARPRGGEAGGGRDGAWRKHGLSEGRRAGDALAAPGPREPGHEAAPRAGRRGCGRPERRCGRAIPAGEEGGARGAAGVGGAAPGRGRGRRARGPERDWARRRPRSSGEDGPGRGRKAGGGGGGGGAGCLSRRRRIGRGRAAPPAGRARAGSSRGAPRPRPPPGRPRAARRAGESPREPRARPCPRRLQPGPGNFGLAPGGRGRTQPGSVLFWFVAVKL